MAGFDKNKAETVAREDWIEDSKGYYELNYARFTESWFQVKHHECSMENHEFCIKNE